MTSSLGERCPDLGALSDAVAKAIAETRTRKAAYEDAKANKGDTAQMLAELQFARNSELKAEHAFRKHIREHGCKS
jgi:hypothetical protein